MYQTSKLSDNQMSGILMQPQRNLKFTIVNKVISEGNLSCAYVQPPLAALLIMLHNVSFL
jgi:hypothetical protein